MNVLCLRDYKLQEQNQNLERLTNSERKFYKFKNNFPEIMNFTPFIVSFMLVSIAELGDKTQFAVINLSSKLKTSSVFLGAMSAFSAVTLFSMFIGGVLTFVIPMFWVNLFSGLIFLVFGFYIIYSLALKKSRWQFEVEKTRGGIFSSFTLVTLMELGDKTQFAVIALSMKYSSLLAVYIGSILAFLSVTAFGVIIGSALKKYLQFKYVQLINGFIFVLLGVTLLIEA